MELILKENVAHLGFKDEIVDVKDGYGRNYLIPKGKAVLATSSAKKVLAENLKQKAFKEKAVIDEANKLAKKIEKLEIKVKTKVGPDGKLFGSISNIDISNSLADKKIELEKDNISIPGRTLKRAGKYVVTVRVHREVSAQLAFEIEPDEESIKLMAAAKSKIEKKSKPTEGEAPAEGETPIAEQKPKKEVAAKEEVSEEKPKKEVAAKEEVSEEKPKKKATAKKAATEEKPKKKATVKKATAKKAATEEKPKKKATVKKATAKKATATAKKTAVKK
jgi:large subunit ribosomal protein L9